ncbi:MAG: DUF4465 domain-containing protein [Flavobacteriales bacterium]
MRNKKLFTLSLSLLATSFSFAQQTEAVFVGNSGTSTTNFSLSDKQGNLNDFQSDVGTAYVQYALSERQLVYLAATDSIYRFDAVNQTTTAAAFDGVSTNTMLIEGDYLFVGNQFGTTTAQLQVFDKTTLASIQTFPGINYPVSDLVAMDGVLFVLQNIPHTVELFPGYALDSLALISRIKLSDLSLGEPIVFDADSAHNMEKMFAFDNQIHLFGTHEMGATIHSKYTYSNSDSSLIYNDFDYDINLTYGNQTSQNGAQIAFPFNQGIGLYDLAGDSLINPSLIANAPTAFAIDWQAEEIYFSKGDYSSFAYGTIYNFDADSIGSYDVGSGYSPEAICLLQSAHFEANDEENVIRHYINFGPPSIPSQTTISPISRNDVLDESHTVEIIEPPMNGTANLIQTGTNWSVDYQFDNQSSGYSAQIQYRIINAFNDADTATLILNPASIGGLGTYSYAFDYVDLPDVGYLNGSEVFGGFLIEGLYSELAFAHNSYNPTYDSWSGIALSNLNDTQTPGYGNQYSVFSETNINHFAFAVVNGNSEANTIEFSTEEGLETIDIANTTYAALSMQNGDGFAKKFGGDDGNDPDWFKITIYGYDSENQLIDSVEHYLADFRFDDNSLDYIQDDWETIHLGFTSLYTQPIFKLRFKFSSSDNGAFGMNTPAYACIDNILFEEYFSLDEETQSAFNLYPNPANTQLNVQLNQQDVEVKQAIITDVLGRTIAKYDLKSSEALSFDVSSLEKGQYFLILKNETEQFSQAFTKL